MRSKRHIMLVGAVVASLALTVQACGSSSGTTSTSSGDSSDSATSTGSVSLPSSIASSGVLSVGAFFNYPPYTIASGNSVSGVEPDLISAVAEELGVKAEFHNLAFEAMIPSVLNGRSDVLIGPFADIAARRKKVTFIDTLKVEMRMLVPAGNPDNIDPDDLCGTTAGESAGSQQLQLLKADAKKCAAEGKPKMTVLTFTDPSESFLAVTSGRTDYTVQDPALAAYTAKQNSKLELLDDHVMGDTPIAEGWVVDKDDPELAEAIVAAIKSLIADGTWQKIMTDNGLGDLAIEPPTINLKSAD
ncbi:MAG: ABC transporter substrate-binding protein [Nocardioides sp.]|uniref:ABC transporter substrate-binding protein n=1 Tax=Nocardioides sp. TaxID=35761 RepID=UPI0039E63602